MHADRGTHFVRARAPRGSFAEELFPPELPWEGNCTAHTVFFDDEAKVYRLWYRTNGYFAYAESRDFEHWHKPMLAHVPFESSSNTNLLGIVNVAELASSDLKSAADAQLGHAGSFFVDPTAPEEERFKCTFIAPLKEGTHDYAKRTGRPISVMTGPRSGVMFGAVSADGVGWRVLPEPIMLHDGDTLTVVRFDPVSRRYVMYTRLYELGRRTVGHAATSDFARWSLPRNMFSPGPNDSPAIDYYASAFGAYPGRADLRTMLCLEYDRAVDGSIVRFATSRDGHVFHSVPGEAAIEPRLASRPSGNFTAAFPSLVRTPDGRMLVFCDVHSTPHKFPRYRFGGSDHCAAEWPADRLAGIEASEDGSFTTAPLRLDGDRAVINFRAARTGGVRVEARDESFRILDGRSFDACDPLFGDETSAPVTWRGDGDLSEFRGRTIYLRFRLRAAKLFSVSAID